MPLTLVRAAVDTRRRARAEEAEIDQFWCVFDVEWPKQHPALHEAIHLAQQHGIHVAVSNPCFELWLVLHHQDQTGWLDNDTARRLRRSCDGSPDKNVDGATYMSRRGEAARRARLLDERHHRNGTTFPDDNPSSGMHRLLATVEPTGPR